MNQTILGANGAIGIALAEELSKYTNSIKLVSRNPKKVNPNDILFSADLLKTENVFKAIENSSIVYVTIGFPYKTKIWQQQWIPFMKSVIEACLKYNSKLVFFDNIYSIGGDYVKHITEESPISPTSKKGAIRAEIVKLILKNIEKNGLKAIIVRAPDFFGGTSYDNSIITKLVFDKLKNGKKAQWLCNTNRIHSFAYVPELAKGTAMLGNTEKAYNQIWNLPTDTSQLTGKEWIYLFAKEINCEPKFSTLPSWLFKILGIFVPNFKEIEEMNYQFDRDYFFDSSKFNNYFNYTPITNEEAVKQTVAKLK
ncbi:MAG TPA: NAD-dependent epimerase/dehydratase family protein [Edaphocola sp.]|nr:NAD-dependent epimerase/dehydratase family protein [Edaphocola sp.]